MANGNNIYIRGFGSFINKKRKKKIARNISRNTALVIDEHYVPSFKPAKIFVSKIKGSEKVKQLADTAEKYKEEDVD
jgi:DNA-binding protein HU-beta